ncbi:hypothetical protein GLOIN_2v1471333 [Rhizophagus clarus]|uniref:Uncharacterized protein n=1 Tax=Rhizophagus clarus TaxID=94130 RepID=A0A8H3L0E8_9GLOM|nr:hypothetical protein GLOIN_2v1471333 [Rhizophagus clarus]
MLSPLKMLEMNISYDPTSFDILISDICVEDLHEVISDKLNVKYLSDSKQEHGSNIEGIIHGRFPRLICALTVKMITKIKFVHFIVDTGSPMSYLSEDVMSAFGLFIPNTDDLINARINKNKTIVMLSPPNSHFSKMNILGTEFMKSSSVKLVIAFSNNSFMIEFPEDQD